ncbi:alpha/beta hydrolase [Flavobacterium amniphilum]|uniref:alpha/beta fold hydrolase n=1 Tax=Flavobacterium amniphilum TaxID=1834035 RepID=UPI00202AAF22|nr:alpha/beta hydrolase [Flavobacterium amniphilum]MCL9803985.1 alpha/beta hydrolase [Flavobacterium amniphilum]
MKKSLTYHLTLWVLHLKGIKKTFRNNPIDYKKLRKEDVHQPKGRFFKKHKTGEFTVLNTTISEIKHKEDSGKLLLFVHGGAFVSGPAKHHWDTIKQLAEQTHFTVWMCNYPKAPENKITAITENIAAVYHYAQSKFGHENITLIGDSVGGTLITALTQELIQRNKALPYHLILISPVMDATFSNPEIEETERKDPMLSQKGALSAKTMCAGETTLTNPIISPLNGSFEQFPKTSLFLAENDITYPDQKLLAQKLREANVDFEVVTGKEMPHIWPFLPVMKEAKMALQQIITLLNTRQQLKL